MFLFFRSRLLGQQSKAILWTGLNYITKLHKTETSPTSSKQCISPTQPSWPSPPSSPQASTQKPTSQAAQEQTFHHPPEPLTPGSSLAQENYASFWIVEVGELRRKWMCRVVHNIRGVRVMLLVSWVGILGLRPLVCLVLRVRSLGV
jgi:hypothetical protein